MTKSLTRALRRRAFSQLEQMVGKVSIMNSYGSPIGKPLCIRSLRRANRQWAKIFLGKVGSDMPDALYCRNSSKRIARSVRSIARHINLGL